MDGEKKVFSKKKTLDKQPYNQLPELTRLYYQDQIGVSRECSVNTMYTMCPKVSHNRYSIIFFGNFWICVLYLNLYYLLE